MKNVALAVIKREGSPVERNNASQRSRYGVKQVLLVQITDDRVVDLQKSTIAFCSTFDLRIEYGDFLVGLHVSDCKRDLLRYLSQELSILIGISRFCVAPYI